MALCTLDIALFTENSLQVTVLYMHKYTLTNRTCFTISYFVFSFFIWFTYTSYQNHPTRSYREPENNVNMVKILYDQTLDVIDHISTENIEVVQDFMKKLADGKYLDQKQYNDRIKF